MSITTQKYDRVKAIVRQAGNLIMEIRSRPQFEIHHKGALDLVTEADQRSEHYICETLVKEFPEDSVMAEEGFEHEGSSGYQWVLDPLDGTTSFAHGFPFFAVSLAYRPMNKGPASAAMVFNPMLNEFFEARSGKGAYLNGRPIQVSRIAKIQDALLGTGFPYNRREIMERLMQRLADALMHCADVRRTGSAAMDLCYVACGRLDGYFEQGLKPWDTAAAALIVREAGGILSRFDGSPFSDEYPEIIAATPKVHHDIVGIVSRNRGS